MDGLHLTAAGLCRQLLHRVGAGRAHGAEGALVLARQKCARPGVGDRLPGICHLQLDSRGNRFCGLCVQRRASVQTAGHMDDAEQGG